MFVPLLQMETKQDFRIHEIIADAKKYLQTLVRLYYIRHGYDAMDLFIIVPLVLVASDCVEAVNDQMPTDQLELLRSTLILAATGLYNQRRNHYLAEALFRVIWGRMRSPEIALLKDSMKMDKGEWDERKGMAQAVRSHWPVSVVKKKEDLESHILANLVENYAHLNVEKDSQEGEKV
jgi:hypothetical protein